MTANSYLEYFMTILGWVINNGLWDVLTSTGLFALPLAFKVIGIWIKVREEGDDEGNKGALALPRIENALYGAFFVMIACCVPLIQVSVSTMSYDTTRASTCGTWTPTSPEKSGYSNIISSIGDETAAIPVWWAVVHRVSKGVTQASVAAIPCRPDLRQVRFEVQHSRIKNKALAEELQDFTNDCYSLGIYEWKRNDRGKTTDSSTLNDLGWIGSSTLLKNYYPDLNSKMPRADFPYDSSRDSGRPNTGNGGYPTCSEWWSDSEVGLKARVKEQADPGMWLRLSAAMKMIDVNSTDYEEKVIRRLVSPQNLNVSQNGAVYAGYGGNADGLSLGNAAARTASTIGTAVGSLAAFPALDALRQALPMVQAVLLMAIYIMIPMILVFSAYEYKTVITLTFVVFALNFLTFWWELARWMDSWLMTALYSSSTHSSFNMAGFQNSQDDIIMNFVMGAMFFVLPVVWLGALSWAGVNIGGALGQALGKGTEGASEAGGKGGKIVTDAVKK